MKLKIVTAQKVSEIQMKSGFHGLNESSTDVVDRPSCHGRSLEGSSFYSRDQMDEDLSLRGPRWPTSWTDLDVSTVEPGILGPSEAG